MPRPPKEILGMVIGDLIFRVTGFGPSKSICDPFAEQVLDEAEKVGYDIKLNLP